MFQLLVDLELSFQQRKTQSTLKKKLDKLIFFLFFFEQVKNKSKYSNWDYKL